VEHKLNAEQVRGAVRRFWLAFESKSGETLAEFYAHESSVFGSNSTRAEPGRLAAARRQREYFHSQSVIKVDVGEIDVLILGGAAAVASYGFKFHASKVASLLGKSVEEDIEQGRATQVFSLDANGELRIMHEHLSLPAK